MLEKLVAINRDRYSPSERLYLYRDAAYHEANGIIAPIR